jgi:hypothetical protein
LTIRIPASLKDRLETVARAVDVSLNAWTTRCVEQCADLDLIGRYLGEIIATGEALASEPTPGAFSPDTLREMVEHIQAQVEELAQVLGWRGRALETLSSDVEGASFHVTWTPDASRHPRCPRSRRSAAGTRRSCPGLARDGADLQMPLACPDPHPHAPGMFVVSETEAAAIRTAFEQGGELAAAIAVRRLFPGITDNAQARACARTITGWKPPSGTPRPVTRLHPGRER